jgi:hypothetical protein
VPAELIRKSRKWGYATTMLREEGSGIEKQVAGRIVGPGDEVFSDGLVGISAMVWRTAVGVGWAHGHFALLPVAYPHWPAPRDLERIWALDACSAGMEVSRHRAKAGDPQ